MKYISRVQIEEALRVLEKYNTFFGVTFLVLKMLKAPVGEKRRLKLDAENRKFLEAHYRVHPKSEYFFRVFRPTNRAKDWVAPNYASTGLQAINTQTFRDALLHERNDDTWGWDPNYLEHLASRLPRRSIRLPIYHLAVWIYRERAFDDDVTRSDVTDLLIDQFAITTEELECLFQRDIVSDLTEEQSFQDVPVRWHEILTARVKPNDVPAESSGVLRYLESNSVGPAHPLVFQPSKGLNLITGDNGLGKTFLLDLSWWALTEEWADRPATPTNASPSKPPYIKIVLGDTQSRAVRATYKRDTGEWMIGSKAPVMSGLAVYARIDGSFAVWDPANPSLGSSGNLGHQTGPNLNFTREEIWNGRPMQLEGLIRDWVKWQQRPDLYPAFDTFKAILGRIFPSDLGPLQIGMPTRIPNDTREIPTLIHPYGTVPIFFESAGIRRIITLAYLLVWAWEEHKIRANLQNRGEERQMIVLVDEVEAHLHPKWQRSILPTLLEVGTELHAEMSVQWLITTHAPLVLASGEAVWNNSSDSLFHIDMNSQGKVAFQEISFERRGNVDSWLTSDIFEIRHPGSREREDAISAAIALQQSDHPSEAAIKAMTRSLNEHLPSEDPFWIRWAVFLQAQNALP